MSVKPAEKPPLRDMVFVHIVESPKPIDLLDGRTEGRVLSEALRLAGIQSTYNLAVSKETFGEALTTRCINAIKALDSRIPILHLSMHGNKNEIGLTDDTRIPWSEFHDWLLPMNKAFKGNLLVCLSACYSTFGSTMAMKEDGDPPFHALIGHPDTAGWDDAAVAFVTFYHQLFRGVGVRRAVECMRIASGDFRFTCRFGKEVQKDWAEHMRQERTADLIRRIEELEAKIDGHQATRGPGDARAGDGKQGGFTR